MPLAGVHGATHKRKRHSVQEEDILVIFSLWEIPALDSSTRTS